MAFTRFVDVILSTTRLAISINCSSVKAFFSRTRTSATIRTQLANETSLRSSMWKAGTEMVVAREEDEDVDSSFFSDWLRINKKNTRTTSTQNHNPDFLFLANYTTPN